MQKYASESRIVSVAKIMYINCIKIENFCTKLQLWPTCIYDTVINILNDSHISNSVGLPKGVTQTDAK